MNDVIDNDEGYIYVGSIILPSRIIKLLNVDRDGFEYSSVDFKHKICNFRQPFKNYVRLGWLNKQYAGYNNDKYLSFEQLQIDFEKYTVKNALEALP